MSAIAREIGALEVVNHILPRQRRLRMFQFLRALHLSGKATDLIIHSPLSLSVVFFLFAKARGRRITALVWDVYPVTLNGRRYNSSPFRILLDWIEERLLCNADSILVPTSDFLPHIHSCGRIRVSSFWYCPETLQPYVGAPAQDDVPIIAFAGQINDTRGVADAIRELDRVFPDGARVHIFSSHELTVDHLENLTIVNFGLASQDELSLELRKAHYGLVCLSKHLDNPGFPSKTVDYLASGLPVLYFGRRLPAYEELLERCDIGISIEQCQVRLDARCGFVESNYLEGRANFFLEIGFSVEDFFTRTDIPRTNCVPELCNVFY